MQQQLQEILDINQQMLSLVQDNQWEELLTLATQRQSHIEDYFKSDDSTNQAQQFESVLNSIEQTDLNISKLIAEQKGIMIAKNISLQKSFTAINHYKSTQASNIH